MAGEPCSRTSSVGRGADEVTAEECSREAAVPDGRHKEQAWPVCKALGEKEGLRER